MPAKLTTQEFINKAKLKHGDKFGYDKVNYINAETKVIITCKTHGDFLQKPGNHLFGACCRQCRVERTGRANSMSQEEFISKSQEVHGQKYDYSKVAYTGCFNPVEIICLKHESFYQKPSIHLTNHGCPKCGKEARGTLSRKTTETFIKDAIKAHGNFYDYSLVEYENSHKCIKIICPNHGIFSQLPYMHTQGQGCPICSKSKGEIEVARILTLLGITFNIQKTFPNCKNRWKLRYDFYFELNSKEYLIEYDGEQHINGWSGKVDSLTRIQKHDAIKTAFAAANGFTLIRIPYTEFNNIETIIRKALNSPTSFYAADTT